jgi:hypothetical protein
MSASENAVKFMAGAIMKLQSQAQAQDLLLKALYAERATQRELFPVEAEEEVNAIATSIERAPRSGYEGEERHLADVQAAIRLFADGLRVRLEEQHLGR